MKTGENTIMSQEKKKKRGGKNEERGKTLI